MNTDEQYGIRIRRTEASGQAPAARIAAAYCPCIYLGDQPPSAGAARPCHCWRGRAIPPGRTMSKRARLMIRWHLTNKRALERDTSTVFERGGEAAVKRKWAAIKYHELSADALQYASDRNAAIAQHFGAKVARESVDKSRFSANFSDVFASVLRQFRGVLRARSTARDRDGDGADSDITACGRRRKTQRLMHLAIFARRVGLFLCRFGAWDPVRLGPC